MGTCKNCERLWMGLSLSCGYRTIGDDGRERPVTGRLYRAPGLRMYLCCTGLGRARYAWTTGVGRAELRDTQGEHLILLWRSVGMPRCISHDIYHRRRRRILVSAP